MKGTKKQVIQECFGIEVGYSTASGLDFGMRWVAVHVPALLLTSPIAKGRFLGSLNLSFLPRERGTRTRAPTQADVRIERRAHSLGS